MQLRRYPRYFLDYCTHLFRCCSACVYCVCVYITSSPHSRRIGLTPALYLSQSREQRCFRSSVKKRPPWVLQSETLTLSRNTTRESRRYRNGRRRRWKRRWRTRVATEARPKVHPLALPRPAAGVPPGYHDDRDVHTRRWIAANWERERTQPPRHYPVGLAVASRTKTPCA